MANALTGQFDAVVQVRVEAVNRLLATLHQNGASKNASPSFPHSFATHVGDTSIVSELAQWAGGVLNLQDSGGSKKPSQAPPGVSPAAEAAAQQSMDAINSETVRGTAWVQVSVPRVSFPQGTTSSVDARVQIRAHYAPDPNTRALPTPIHGEVRARFSIRSKTWTLSHRPPSDFSPTPNASDQASDAVALQVTTMPNTPIITPQIPTLEVIPTTNDNEITFEPAPGLQLSAANKQRITQQIRLALRSRFERINVQLPELLTPFRFKSLVSGASQVVAVPLNLSGLTPPPSAVGALNATFVKPGDHFAVAVSKEHVEGMLQPFTSQLNGLHWSFTMSAKVMIIPIPWPVEISVTYDVSISSVQLAWQAGSIKLIVHGSATTDSVLPNYSFTVEQALTLTLHQASQTVSIQAAGDPSVSGDLPGPGIDAARNVIIQHRDAALQQAQSAIQHALTDGITVTDALKAFDDSAAASYGSIEIRPSGVVLHGTVSTRARTPVEVEFRETGDGTAFTALKTWIPAGTITRLRWRWERENLYHYVAHNHLEGVTLTQIDNSGHGFRLPVPEDLPADGRLCLSVEGTQVPSGGGPPYPVWGERCEIVWPVMRVVLPAAWNFPLAAPIWRRGPANATLESAIVAHVGAFTPSHDPSAPGANTIVHFAASDWTRPLEILGQGVAARGRRNAPVAVVLVLPREAFRARRGAVTGRLGSLGRGFSGSVILTEDYDSGWTRTFAVDRTPATFVINSQGEVAWRHVGRLDAGELSAALEEHAISGPKPRHRLHRLAVRPRDPALDVLLADVQGERLALRKLRGRPVLLTFWKSWSAPCLAELARLQRAHEQAGPRGPVILAINDGEDRQRPAEISREHQLTLPMVPDPDREIARRYQVNCWPTTVAIDEAGRVDRVHFGVMPELAPGGRDRPGGPARSSRRQPEAPSPRRPKPRGRSRS